MPLTKIAVIGANGHLGPHVLRALQSNPTFKITILSRASSKSTYPPSIHVHSIPDEMPHSALVSALTGQDALVLSFAGTIHDLNYKLIAAAYEARVRRVIPADFGSADSADPRTLNTIRDYPAKKAVRDHLIELSAQAEQEGWVFSWTSIICANFLDFGLQTSLLGFDVPAQKARVFDGGDVVFSVSMLRTVGVAVARVLEKEEETRDRIVYIHSLSTTQNRLLEAVEQVVGERFEVQEFESESYLEGLQERLRTHPDDAEAMDDLIGVEGMVNSDWRGKEGFANELLGLPEEDLVELVRESLA